MDSQDLKHPMTQATPNSASLAEILLQLKDNNEGGALSSSKSDLIQTPLQGTNSNSEKVSIAEAKSQETQDDICNCKKSKCLKLYCQCFSSKALCGPLCRCTSCENRDGGSELRMQAMQMVLEKNPQGFESKYTAAGAAQLSNESSLLVAHRNGCRCRKSACLKKYCECFQGKVLCSAMCTCRDCMNNGEGAADGAGRYSFPAGLGYEQTLLMGLPSGEQILVAENDIGFMPKSVYQGFTVRRAVSMPPSMSTASPVVPLIKRRKYEELMPLARTVSLGSGSAPSPFATITPQAQHSVQFFGQSSGSAPMTASQREEYMESTDTELMHKNSAKMFAAMATPNTLNIAHALTSMALPPMPPKPSPIYAPLTSMHAVTMKDGVAYKQIPVFRSREQMPSMHSTPQHVSGKMEDCPPPSSQGSTDTYVESYGDENSPAGVDEQTPIKGEKLLQGMARLPLCERNVC